MSLDVIMVVVRISRVLVISLIINFDVEEVILATQLAIFLLCENVTQVVRIFDQLLSKFYIKIISNLEDANCWHKYPL